MKESALENQFSLSSSALDTFQTSSLLGVRKPNGKKERETCSAPKLEEKADLRFPRFSLPSFVRPFPVFFFLPRYHSSRTVQVTKRDGEPVFFPRLDKKNPSFLELCYLFLVCSVCPHKTYPSLGRKYTKCPSIG